MSTKWWVRQSIFPKFPLPARRTEPRLTDFQTERTFVEKFATSAVTAVAVAGAALAANPAAAEQVTYKVAKVSGLDIFYREAATAGEFGTNP